MQCDHWHSQPKLCYGFPDDDYHLHVSCAIWTREAFNTRQTAFWSETHEAHIESTYTPEMTIFLGEKSDCNIYACTRWQTEVMQREANGRRTAKPVLPAFEVCQAPSSSPMKTSRPLFCPSWMSFEFLQRTICLPVRSSPRTDHWSSEQQLFPRPKSCWMDFQEGILGGRSCAGCPNWKSEIFRKCFEHF
jgi:hypothetical protein